MSNRDDLDFGLDFENLDSFEKEAPEGGKWPPCDPCEGVIDEEVATVCLPVLVIPHADVGPIEVKCDKRPGIELECKRCKGKPNGCCEFAITQKIRVKIPVTFSADVEIGETFIDCKCDKPYPPHPHGECEDCKED